jgi:hypothetical protein
VHAPLQPLRGFSWRGWLLLPIALALLYCYLGGFDLRAALQQLIAEHLGVPAMLDFTSRILPPWSLGFRGPVAGPACLLYILPAMFIAPSRWRWWAWTAVTALCVAAPWYWWKLILISSRMPPAAHPWTQAASDLIPSLALIALIAAGARSLTLALQLLAVTLLATLGTAGLEYAAQRSTLPAIAATFPWLALAWHLALAAFLLRWAISSRRHFRQDPNLCPSCGYHAAGLPTCPECGRAQLRIEGQYQ